MHHSQGTEAAEDEEAAEDVEAEEPQQRQQQPQLRHHSHCRELQAITAGPTHLVFITLFRVELQHQDIAGTPR